MKKLFRDAAVGLFFATIAAATVRFFGFARLSLIFIMYLMVALAVLQGLKSRTNITWLPSILERVVIVAEGEELKLKKLITGEKYRVKGDLEKL